MNKLVRMVCFDVRSVVFTAAICLLVAGAVNAQEARKDADSRTRTLQKQLQETNNDTVQVRSGKSQTQKQEENASDNQLIVEPTGDAAPVESSVSEGDAIQKAHVMVLGVFHMANPGNDLFNLKVDDVLAPKAAKRNGGNGCGTG